jgi:hypothetical protein
MNEAVQIPDEIGSDSRPAHILGVAKDEFLANGFAATTIFMIRPICWRR